MGGAKLGDRVTVEALAFRRGARVHYNRSALAAVRPKVDSKRTFFVTSVTAGRRSIFRVDRNAELLLEVLLEQRTAGRCWLHEFVVMRDHFHLLVTPSAKIALERLMQFIKGGFSYRYGRMANSKAEIWQKSFTLRRIMNAADYAAHAAYIRLNPVRAGMVADANDYLYSSANPRFALDPAPQGLKPRVVGGTKTPA